MLEAVSAAFAAFGRAARGMVQDEIERRQLPGAVFGKDVIIRGAKHIRAGKGLFLDHRAYLACNKINGRTGSIVLGRNVEIGPNSVLWGGGGITIADNVHVGANVHIISVEAKQIAPEDTGATDPLNLYWAPVTIESHVLINSNSVILPGVTIGHHALIGHGVVVKEDVPAYAVLTAPEPVTAGTVEAT